MHPSRSNRQAGVPIAVCQPRTPADSILYQAVHEHWPIFLTAAHESGRSIPEFVRREFDAFMGCGILERGANRVHCPHCGFDRLVPFSCESRSGLCRSCAARRMVELIEYLSTQVIANIPTRQWVLTVPPPSDQFRTTTVLAGRCSPAGRVQLRCGMTTTTLSYLVSHLVALATPQPSPFAFNRVMDTPYPKHSGTAAGDVAVGDVTGDGRKDLLIVGAMNGKATTLLHTQNADGTFAPGRDAAALGLPALSAGALVRLADLDGDRDLDVVLAGRTGAGNETALFAAYRNNGQGQFQPLADLGAQLPLEDFDDVAGSWGKAATQPDNKTDADVKGIYNFNGWSRGALETVDLNGDGNLDIVYAGTKGMESGTDSAGQMIQRDWETSGVFLGNGSGGFKFLTAAGWPQAGVPADPEKEPARSYPGLPKVHRAALATGRLQRRRKNRCCPVRSGEHRPKANFGIPESQRNGEPVAEVVLGKGDGTFSRVANPGLIPMIDGALVAVDFNQDGKLDLAALGSTGHPKNPNGGRAIRIYLGKGDGTFAPDAKQNWQRVGGTNAGLTPMMSGDLAFGDLDGDGDLDLVAGGNASNRELFVYRNDKGVLSVESLDKSKNGLGSTDARGGGSSDASAECDVRIDDLDGDGDLDVVLNGRGGSTQLLVFLNRRK